MKILLTGATGYVGGRLLKALGSKNHFIRCLARRPEFLKGKKGISAEIVKGDLLDEASLENAMEGIDTVYYLVHSMGSKGTFDQEESRSALNFVKAAQKKGIRRIIYLGGLSHGEKLSPHLKSRQAVGQILRDSGILTIEFQASIIIGSGSLSFEMIRSLMDRLPVMTTPKWVRSLAQPIAIEDVVQYLALAADLPIQKSRTFEIGGPEKMSYADLMKEYGKQKGLKRLIIPVPVLSPGLSSLWLGLVTPLYARVGRKLIESMRHDTVVEDPSALNVFPVHPMPVREAIRRALKNEDQDFSSTRWSDALSSSYKNASWGGSRFGSRLIESNSILIDAKPQEVFEVISRIGGKNGWYYANWLWRLRGAMDLLAGGIGTRRGRRDESLLSVGDTLDWWRVEAIEPNSLLRLLAEMKVPGRAWLQFEVQEEKGKTLLRQTAIFDPLGLWGLAYWYGLYPIHYFVFSGMLKAIAKSCQPQKPADHPSKIKFIILSALFLGFLAGNSYSRDALKTMTLTSPSFDRNQRIPDKFTCQDEDINPELIIEGVPYGAKSLVLIVDDPDAPRGTWLHWLVYDIPPATLKIAQNSVPGKEGITSFGKQRYGGPCPPVGTHRYFFKLYALDRETGLKGGADRKSVEAAMEKHILAKAEWVGIYKKSRV